MVNVGQVQHGRWVSGSDDLNCWLSNCGHLMNGWKEQFYDVFWPFSVFIPSPFPKLADVNGK